MENLDFGYLNFHGEIYIGTKLVLEWLLIGDGND